MIFITVGTHEQPFNRLIEYVDKLKEYKILDEEVVIQTGFSTYEPKYCNWRRIYPYDEMVKYVNRAKIIITHGGPSSFIMPLQVGKIPVVVPRQKKYDEHVNDHQLDFANAVAKRKGNILVINNIEDLKDTILNYDEIVKNMPNEIKSNNDYFNKNLEKIVEDLFD
ncbi:TPA: multidrug MFS transporter [Clostridium perfringens]|nr:multidrug MFS transporter [Clostridium perfringens]